MTHNRAWVGGWGCVQNTKRWNTINRTSISVIILDPVFTDMISNVHKIQLQARKLSIRKANQREQGHRAGKQRQEPGMIQGPGVKSVSPDLSSSGRPGKLKSCLLLRWFKSQALELQEKGRGLVWGQSGREGQEAIWGYRIIQAVHPSSHGPCSALPPPRPSFFLPLRECQIHVLSDSLLPVNKHCFLSFKGLF